MNRLLGWILLFAIVLAEPAVAGSEALGIRPEVPPFLGHPSLDLKPARATRSTNRMVLENGYLRLEWIENRKTPLRATLHNLISGLGHEVTLLNPQIVTAGRSFSATDFVTSGWRIEEGADRAALEVKLTATALEASARWELGRGDHYVRQEVRLRNLGAQTLKLNEVWVERLGFVAGEFPNVRIKKTTLTDVVAHLDGPRDGLFATLDFPFCLLRQAEAGRIDLGYPPEVELAAGAQIDLHPVVFGISTARTADNPDSGPEFAFLRWVSRAYPPRIKEPQLHLYHVDNDMYDPRGGLYYSYRGPDMGAFLRNLPATLTMLELSRDLGFNSYQTMEEPFAFREGENPVPAEWERIRRFAERHSIRFGAGPISNQGILTPMNNPYLRPFSYGTGGVDEKSEFYRYLFRDKEGKRIPRRGFNLAYEKFATYFENELVRLAQTYGFNWYNYDELPIRESFDAEDGLPNGGPASIYRQVLNLTRVLDNVRRRVPGLLWDTNLGFIPLQPKIVKHVDGIYPNDPTGAQGIRVLNRNLVYDESRRRIYTHALTDTGLPPVFFRQCQYFLADDALVRNLRVFQYEILLNFAMGPNLAVGHLWSELNELPYGQSVRAREFLLEWIRWARENYRFLASTRYLGQSQQSAHVYSHILGDRGFVFLVNPNLWTAQTEFILDSSIGLWAGEQFEVVELHPARRRILASRLPWARWKDAIRLEVEPQTVRIIEVRPATEIASPVLVGAEGRIEAGPDGSHLVRIEGRQGRELAWAVLFPAIQTPAPAELVPQPEIERNTERQLKQLPGGLLRQSTRGSWVWGAARIPRMPARPELREWSLRTESLKAGLEDGLAKGFSGETVRLLPSYSIPTPGGFHGAHIANLFEEQREVTIRIRTLRAEATASSDAMLDAAPRAPAPGVISSADSLWLSTKTTIPFVQVDGQRPAPDRHLYIALILERPQEAETPRLWVNGKEAAVRWFSYTRVKDGCYYVDGTEAGLRSEDNTIVIWVGKKMP